MLRMAKIKKKKIRKILSADEDVNKLELSTSLVGMQNGTDTTVWQFLKHTFPI